MIFKQIDDMSTDIAILEIAIAISDRARATSLEQQLQDIRCAVRAKQQAAHEIDQCVSAINHALVLHDLRFVVDGEIIEIEHLILHRSMTFFVVATAGAVARIEAHYAISSSRHEVLQNQLSSAMKQNARRVHYLAEIFARLPLPMRFGSWIVPDVRSVICVDPELTTSTNRFPTHNLIEVDQLVSCVDGEVAKMGFITRIARFVDRKTIFTLAEALMGGHRRCHVTSLIQNTANAYKDKSAPIKGPPHTERADQKGLLVQSATMICPVCAAGRGSIFQRSSRYYFQCEPAGHTKAIKLLCPEGHTMTVRKNGGEVFSECAACELTVPLGTTAISH